MIENMTACDIYLKIPLHYLHPSIASRLLFAYKSLKSVIFSRGAFEFAKSSILMICFLQDLQKFYDTNVVRWFLNRWYLQWFAKQMYPLESNTTHTPMSLRIWATISYVPLTYPCTLGYNLVSPTTPPCTFGDPSFYFIFSGPRRKNMVW